MIDKLREKSFCKIAEMLCRLSGGFKTKAASQSSDVPDYPCSRKQSLAQRHRDVAKTRATGNVLVANYQ